MANHDGDELTGKIIAAAIEVHRFLGCGFREAVYERALSRELGLRGLTYRRQIPVRLTYKGIALPGHRLDLIVADKVIVELKASPRLNQAAAIAQLLSYLKAARVSRGLILNFGLATLRNGIKRVSL